MKVIIDISKEDFEIIKHNMAVDNPLCPISQRDMVIKIANGTPLEDIRAEIEVLDMQPDGIHVSSYTRHDTVTQILQIIDCHNGEGGKE